MSYMVNFGSPEGKSGYHPTDALEEAVRFVEHLRNQEQGASVGTDGPGANWGSEGAARFGRFNRS